MRADLRTPITLLLAGALAASCNGASDSGATPELDEIPSQAELDDQASQEIDQQNADETFRALQQEIDSDE